MINNALSKEWYDYLKQGKFMGLKCKSCGTIDCPPFPVCNTCSSTDLEWVEMSGEGVLETFSFSAMGALPYNPNPKMIGFIKLKEGPNFMAILDDDLAFDENGQQALIERLPLPVYAEIKAFDENVSYPVFHIKND